MMPRWMTTGLAPPAGHVLEALLEDRLGQDGGGGGAVAGDVAGLAGDGADQLGAHVLERLLQLDLLGDGDAVLGDPRRAERLLQHDVPAARAERGLDGPGQLRHPAEKLRPGGGLEHHLFRCHGLCSEVLFTAETRRTRRSEAEAFDDCRARPHCRPTHARARSFRTSCGLRVSAVNPSYSSTPRMSDLAEDDELLAVHLDVGAGVLAVVDLSPARRPISIGLPLSSSLPGPTEMTLPLGRLFLGRVRQQDAALGLLLGLGLLDDHTVLKGSEFHGWFTSAVGPARRESPAGTSSGSVSTAGGAARRYFFILCWRSSPAHPSSVGRSPRDRWPRSA